MVWYDKAAEKWPTPSDRKQLQRFLGFTNFYRRFIKNYSCVAAPLTKLISTLRTFIWTPEAEQAFGELKALFSSAPILYHSVPSKQFIVEVDASYTPKWRQYSLKDWRMVMYTVVHIFLDAFHLQKGIML